MEVTKFWLLMLSRVLASGYSVFLLINLTQQILNQVKLSFSSSLSWAWPSGPAQPLFTHILDFWIKSIIFGLILLKFCSGRGRHFFGKFHSFNHGLKEPSDKCQRRLNTEFVPWGTNYSLSFFFPGGSANLTIFCNSSLINYSLITISHQI